MQLKRSLLVGAAVATSVAGVAGVGLASADTLSTNTSSSSSSSIVDKLADKFHLNKSDVQAVFDEDHAAHRTQMEADQKQRLADAVADGKLTQAQADHITSVMNDINTLMGDADPRSQSQTVHDQIKLKMDDLHQWAEDNNIDMKYVMGMHGGRDRGHEMIMHSAPTPSAESNN
jgi:gas vesicle protein